MLKWHQNLIFGRPLGTPLFRPKSRQDAPAPQIAAEDGVGPGLLGEDLGGGRQEPLRTRIRKEDPEGFEDLDRIIQHAVPVGRRIEVFLGGVPPPNVFGVRRVAIRKGV